jgi:hypothetical protein
MFGVSRGMRDSGQGRSSAEGGNGNVRDRSAEHKHEAITTPNVKAVRDLGGGAPRGYKGAHRAN